MSASAVHGPNGKRNIFELTNIEKFNSIRSELPVFCMGGNADFVLFCFCYQTAMRFRDKTDEQQPQVWCWSMGLINTINNDR
jgi:hypothetical protein